MTAELDSCPLAEIAVCLSCPRPIEECDGGDPDCPWGRQFYRPNNRRANYLAEYRARNRERLREMERLRRRQRREGNGYRQTV